MLDTGAWLKGYAYTFAILTYLTTVNQYVTIYFSKRQSVMGTFLNEVNKTIKLLKLFKRQKYQRLTHFFIKYFNRDKKIVENFFY